MDEKIGDECGECRQPTVRTCEVCSMRYCYLCCEQEHWSDCRSFEVVEGEGGGCVKAARDLVAGEIVFSEFPVVVGPKLPPEHGYFPCVGCCRLVSIDKLFYCPECSWPACSDQCDDLRSAKTHGLECQILKLDNESPPADTIKNFRFEILLPLRILLLQTIKKTEWEHVVQQLQKNNDKSDTSTNQNDHAEFLQTNLLTPLQKIEEETATTILHHKSSALLLKIFDYVKTNSFQPPSEIPLQILYSKSHLIHHSCTPNTFQTISKNCNYKITIRANSRISKNTPITCSYTNLFQGTHERLWCLKSRKNVSCTCARCRDPTEFGTFFSALKCLGTRTEPCTGTQLPIDPTSNSTIWVCDRCKIELPNDQMVKFVKHLGGEVAKVLGRENTVDEMEEFLAKLLMFLHPNHFYVCQVKHALVKLYEGEDLVMTRVEICRNLVDVARKLYPFGSLLLVELLHGLFEAKLSSLSSEVSVQNEDLDELVTIIKKMKSVVQAFFDPELSQTVTKDESIFTHWLKNHL